eukprot:scpid77716/ scgid23479/ 
MAATATSCQTTILYVAFVGIFLLTDAHSIPVPEPEYSPSPVSATVDTLVHGVDQCLQVGTTYDQIDEFKQSVCQSKDDYLRRSLYPNHLAAQCDWPGNNSVPCVEYTQDLAGWQERLGYIAGVLDNFHRAGFLHYMMEYEIVINRTEENSFLPDIGRLLNETAHHSRLLRNLTEVLAGVELQDLFRKRDVCSDPSGDGAFEDDEEWPPVMEVTEDNFAEYRSYLVAYNYGTLKALCLTAGDLHNELQNALDGACPRGSDEPTTSTGGLSDEDVTSSPQSDYRESS